MQSNVTDKVDFQAKLDEGLEVIEEVNITKQFQQVVDPLENIQGTYIVTFSHSFSFFIL